MAEAEERPAKLRKLSHDHDTASDVETVAERPGEQSSLVNGVIVNDLVEDSTTSNNEVRAANGDGDTAAGKPPPTPLVSVPPSHHLYALSLANPTASKNHLKKLKRQQEWEEARTERKQQRKDENAAKKARKRAARDDYLATNNLTLAEFNQNKVEEAKAQGPSATLPITFMIDCDFDALMRDPERISLSGQITRAYSDNRKARWRGHVVLASFGGKLRERHDTVLARNYESWHYFRQFAETFDVVARDGSWMDGKEGGKLVGPFARYVEDLDVAAQPDAEGRPLEVPASAVAGPDAGVAAARSVARAALVERHAALRAAGEVIYLSSESPDTLTELKPYGTYIVGGLVDKNREKGLCYKRAVAAGIKTARLPIGEYLDMSSRKVLATNHVVEIMLRWLECRDWGEAFVKVMPKRKGGVLKTQSQVVEDGKGDDAEQGQEEDGVEDGIDDREEEVGVQTEKDGDDERS